MQIGGWTKKENNNCGRSAFPASRQTGKQSATVFSQSFQIAVISCQLDHNLPAGPALQFWKGVVVQVVQVQGAEVKEEPINLFVTVGHDLCFPPVPQTWKIYLAKICFAGKGHIVVKIEKATKLKVIIFSVFVENISMSNWIELCSCYSKVCHTFSRVQSAILM